MSSQLHPYDKEELSIHDLFLGVYQDEGCIVVHIYPDGGANPERLKKLRINFTYQGEEIDFEVKEVRTSSIPIRLMLAPVNKHDAVFEFLRNVVSVCLVPEVTFIENDSIVVVRNSRYNPSCLN